MPGLDALHRRLPPLSFVASRLDREREERLGGLLDAHRTDVAAVATARERLLEDPRDEGAVRVIDEIARRLLSELRGEVGDHPVARGARWFDENVLWSERQELLDLEAVPRSIKRVTMRLLDHINTRLGSYALWTHALDEALRGREDAHVYDLAAGTGGFGRWLVAHPLDGRRLRVTSSDLEPEYVEIGARAADAGGVTFEVRDALDLRDVRDVDLFVCTQATHHLAPGMLVRLLAQAVAAAPLGILVIDIMRSALVMAASLLATSLVVPFPPLVGDGAQSVRRSYTPAELRLFAMLAGARDIDARTFGPAHVLLHARR